MKMINLIAALLVAMSIIACQQPSQSSKVEQHSPVSVTAESDVNTQVISAEPTPASEKVIAENVELEVVTQSEKVMPTEPVDTVMKEPEVAVAEVKVNETEAAPIAITAKPSKKVEAAIVESVKENIEVPIEENKAVVAVGDPISGAKIAKGKCGACHYFDQAKKKTGPSLMGIYGQAPSIEGVPYSAWDRTALDSWLTNPKAVKSNTKMAFKGIPEQDKRDDIIAYLKTL
jgi:cytochrome c